MGEIQGDSFQRNDIPSFTAKQLTRGCYAIWNESDMDAEQYHMLLNPNILTHGYWEQNAGYQRL